LPFSQHRENCGLLLLDFANHFLIHIFALQNPQIVSISPQSHRAEVDASSFPNNYNASLPIKGCTHVAVCCTICRSRHRRLFRSCGISDGMADSVHCLACRFLCRWLRRSHANSNVSWFNSIGTLICGTWFSKESICSSFC
jgi:hypothetical protein